MRHVELSPGQIAVRRADPAVLPEGGVRVRVQACGVCGTDLEALRGMVLPRGVDYPLRPGHEVAGEIVEIAADVPANLGLAVGQTVVAHPLAPCGGCPACHRGEEQLCRDVRALGFHDPGGLADELIWPATRVVPVAGLDVELAALLADAVATAYHALRLADPPTGGALCVLGAGGIGAQVLRLARVLHPDVRVSAIVRSQATADLVEQLGAVPIRGLDGAVPVVRSAIGRADAVIDFTGDETAAAAGLHLLRPGGRLIIGSVVDKPIDLGTSVTGITAREISIHGSYVSTMDELRTVTRLAGSGVLDLTDAVSHVLPLERADEALRLLEEHPPGLRRIVVIPEGD